MSVNTIEHGTVLLWNKYKSKYIIINMLYIRPGARIKLIFGRLNRSFNSFFSATAICIPTWESRKSHSSSLTSGSPKYQFTLS